MDTQKNKTDSASIVRACLMWHQKEKDRHRLVFVSSMVTLGKDDHQVLSKVIPVTAAVSPLRSTASLVSQTSRLTVREEMSFSLTSRTFEDYEMAMEHNEFFEHVKSKFTDTLLPVRWEERKQLLEDKYFVVGGSARYMFDLSITDGAILLDSAVDTIYDIEKYVNDYRSVSAEGTVNRLFSWFRDSKNTTFGIVSNYVGRRLAIRLGPDFVQIFSKLLSSNPSMDGHFFELWFFAKLLHGGFECFKIGDNGDIFVHDAWISTTELQYFDPNAYVPVNQLRQWLALQSWNQGGYDAVNVEITDNGTGVFSVRVRFVQVTRAIKHSFKPKFVAYFLQKNADFLRSYQSQTVEVYFVVPLRKFFTFNPNVDERQVRKEVVEVVGLEADTRVVIEVVGVNYEQLGEVHDLNRLETRRVNTH